jgi:hypothetical protein
MVAVFLLSGPAGVASGQSSAAGLQQTPSEIPELQVDDDPTGKIATYQPGGATNTTDNAFFQNLGTNGRTCFTCHQPHAGIKMHRLAGVKMHHGPDATSAVFSGTGKPGA